MNNLLLTYLARKIKIFIHFNKSAGLSILSQKNQNRFYWSTDSLFKCLANVKTCYEFKGLVFKYDLVKLFTGIRTLVAETYDRSDYGPVTTTDKKHDLSAQELAKGTAAIAEEEKSIEMGFQRIK